jgi:hypothetical protein
MRYKLGSIILGVSFEDFSDKHFWVHQLQAETKGESRLYWIQLYMVVNYIQGANP